MVGRVTVKRHIFFFGLRICIYAIYTNLTCKQSINIIVEMRDDENTTCSNFKKKFHNPLYKRFILAIHHFIDKNKLQKKILFITRDYMTPR